MASRPGAEALAAYAADTAGCVRCPLAATRTQVVFGSGDPAAELMLVGEAPDFRDDRQGLPFSGPAGELLERLLAGIGLERGEVYLAHVLKCRPPESRDPREAEIAACEPHLYRQVELVRPRVVATLGTFATNLLSGRRLGIAGVHGREHEVRLGATSVVLYPLFDPAAALYAPSLLGALEDDFGRLPDLLGRRPTVLAGSRPPERPRARAAAVAVGGEATQLGLF